MDEHLSPYVPDFCEALADFCNNLLRESHYDGDYSNEAVKILDARNHLFRRVVASATDEETDVYMLRDLVRIDELTLEFCINQRRILSLARNYFS